MGNVSYSGGGFIARLYVTASWSFGCYLNPPLTDPFDIELLDGQHLSPDGVGGGGSTTFLASDSSWQFTVTTFSACHWTLTGTMTPGLGPAG